MSYPLAGLVRTPDLTAHVAMFYQGSLSIFLTPFDGAASPTMLDLDAWVMEAMKTGVESVAVLPGLPFPVHVSTQVRRVGGVFKAFPSLNGMVQEPWLAVLCGLLARLRAGPASGTLPDGYTFTPAVVTMITAGRPTEC